VDHTTPPGALESAAKMISFFSRLLSVWGSVIRPVSAEQMPQCAGLTVPTRPSLTSKPSWRRPDAK
jgi:hypothetical protein